MQHQKISNAIVIGAGPVGLSAAAHLLAQDITPLVLEKGDSVGHAMSQWGHVSVFSPWKYVFDKQVKALLDNTDWIAPDLEGLPTGQEIVEQYLMPAATATELVNHIKYQAEVIGVTKHNLAKSSSKHRDQAWFNVHVKSSDGSIEVMQTQAVIDASGTWSNPNPIGLDGLPVPGELENQTAITYGIPNVNGDEKETFSNQRVLVLGGGHSAINIALELLKLQQSFPATKVIWGLRSNKLDKLLGGGINDELPARGKLGIAAKKAVDNGQLELLAPFSVKRIEKLSTGLLLNVEIGDKSRSIEVDKVIVATGFRPDLSVIRELRLDLDSIVEAPRQLAPLIDPNLHSCGSVPPHGYAELVQPDHNFFIVGMKAYGRAPTFLMLTGYEQVRSITAAMAGDFEAAKRTELVLTKTGVCSSEKPTSTSCCAPQAQPEKASCCS